MIVMINGSFGVGKTTVARLLRRALPGSAIYDPEWVGLVLMRLSRWIRLRGSGTGDFQDIDWWRSSTVLGAGMFRHFVSGVLIVPMTFSNRVYLDQVVAGLRERDPVVRVFCLKASLATIRKRLAERGDGIEGRGAEWLTRRTAECSEAHRDQAFGESVETENCPAPEVAAEIVRRLEHR